MIIVSHNSVMMVTFYWLNVWIIILGYHTISFSLGQQKRTFDVPINAHQWMNSVSLFVCDNFNMVGCHGCTYHYFTDYLS